MRWLAALVMWTFASEAGADDAQDLVAKGQELAKQGAWSQAITTFKQADAHQPRAETGSPIAVVYGGDECDGAACAETWVLARDP